MLACPVGIHSINFSYIQVNTIPKNVMIKYILNQMKNTKKIIIINHINLHLENKILATIIKIKNRTLYDGNI